MKSANPKINNLTYDLAVRQYLCHSKEWIKWAKTYTSRASRRKTKQNIKKEQYE
jgi:hypothetical protein